jgi:hypothetical protein
MKLLKHYGPEIFAFGTGLLVFLFLYQKSDLDLLLKFAPASALLMGAEMLPGWIVMTFVCLLQGLTYLFIYKFLKWILKSLKIF